MLFAEGDRHTLSPNRMFAHQLVDAVREETCLYCVYCRLDNTSEAQENSVSSPRGNVELFLKHKRLASGLGSRLRLEAVSRGNANLAFDRGHENSPR